MLAQAIRRTWPRDEKAVFWGQADLPAGRARQYEKICRLAPSAIINASGFTNLKRIEERPNLARDLHVETPAFLARTTQVLGIPFATISSDYVFSGKGQTAWSERDTPDPVNAYGRSKLEGERATLAFNPRSKIIRTAGLFGAAPLGSKASFPERILQQARAGCVPEVRSDLTTSICHVDDLAADLANILKGSASGFFHVAHSGGATWLQIAEYVLESAGISTCVKPTQTGDFPRPPCSTLATQRPETLLGQARRKSWQNALNEFMRGFRHA